MLFFPSFDVLAVLSKESSALIPTAVLNLLLVPTAPPPSCPRNMLLSVVFFKASLKSSIAPMVPAPPMMSAAVWSQLIVVPSVRQNCPAVVIVPTCGSVSATSALHSILPPTPVEVQNLPAIPKGLVIVGSCSVKPVPAATTSSTYFLVAAS